MKNTNLEKKIKELIKEMGAMDVCEIITMLTGEFTTILDDGDILIDKIGKFSELEIKKKERIYNNVKKGLDKYIYEKSKYNYSLEEIIENLKRQYEYLKEQINIQKANGDLAKLCNFNLEFVTGFDNFFDNKELRIKYDAWNAEDDEPNFDYSNRDLENMLDYEDRAKYIKFFQNYIEELESELNGLKST